MGVKGWGTIRDIRLLRYTREIRVSVETNERELDNGKKKRMLADLKKTRRHQQKKSKGG